MGKLKSNCMHLNFHPNSIQTRIMKKICFLTLTIYCLGNTHILAGGGWPQPKGHGFFKLAEWWLISDQHFTDQGLIDPNQTTGLFNTTLYTEYGLTDRLTGIFNMPLFSRSYFNNQVSFTTREVIVTGEAINALGDAEISLMYGLFATKGWSASARITLGVPFGQASGGSSGVLQTGDGEFNQMLRFDLGRGFQLGKINAYANAYVGFNNRNQGFSDELLFGIEAGLTMLNNRISVTARLFGVESMQNGSLPSDRNNSTSLFANNAEHLTFAPEIAYHLDDRWGISAGLGKAISGRIIFANTSYTVGVFFKL